MKFKVVYELDEGGAWNASIPSVQGCRTWGRSLGAARRYIREALSACVDVLGEDGDRIAAEAELVEQFKLPAESDRALEKMRQAQAAFAKVDDGLRNATRMAAERLTKAHISARDAGELLGLSHGRVHQLVHAKAKPTAPAARRATRATAPRRRAGSAA